MHQKDTTIINMYASTNRATKSMKQKEEMKEKKNNSTIMGVDFNIQLSIMNKTMRQKINKDVDALNNTVNP